MKPATQTARGAPDIWWLNPLWIIAALLIPAFTVLFLVPELFGWDAVVLLGYRFFRFDYFVLGLLFLLAMLNGVVVGKSRMGRPLSLSNETDGFNRFYLDFLALATIAAYLIWFRGVFFSPTVLAGFLKGGSGINRMEHRTIGGVTTACQFGVAFIILYLTTVWGDANSRLPLRFKGYLFVILMLTVFRVFGWGERVALAEIVVPVFLLYIRYRISAHGRIARIVLNLLPVIGLVVVLGYFGLTEYFRSWATHYQFQHAPFWQFITQRLTTYYFTALNNGAGLLTVMDWPTWQMTYVLGWLHRFPLMVGASVSYVLDTKSYEYGAFLTRYADPEFNNPSGIFTVFLDVGIAGGLAVAAIIGILAGVLYNSMRQGGSLGSILYPLFCIQFMELFRYLYLGNQRVFPAVVALLIGWAFFRERKTFNSNITVEKPGFATQLRPAESTASDLDSG